jgi:hypothetical protein
MILICTVNKQGARAWAMFNRLAVGSSVVLLCIW